MGEARGYPSNHNKLEVPLRSRHVVRVPDFEYSVFLELRVDSLKLSEENHKAGSSDKCPPGVRVEKKFRTRKLWRGIVSVAASGLGEKVCPSASLRSVRLMSLREASFAAEQNIGRHSRQNAPHVYGG